MNKEFIFDMDGTILDSMPAWINLGRNYLLSKEVLVSDDLEKVIADMTLEESSVYFKAEFALQETVERIQQEIIAFISKEYEQSIPLKKGRKELLAKLHQQGCRMCILTTSDYKCADDALKRVGIRQYFEKILTSEELQLSKRTAEIYLEACRCMHFFPETTTVYEDGLTQVISAKEAGCHVVAVYDATSDADWDKIAIIADEVLR